MSGIKKLLFWAVLLTAGYYGLDYVTIQTRGDVLAYKRFAKALIEDDRYSARQASSKDFAAKVFESNEERMSRFEGGRVLLTYFNVISEHISNSGKTSNLTVEQVSRVASGGHTGIWGDRAVRIVHRVALEQKENQQWKVVSFSDPAIR